MRRLSKLVLAMVAFALTVAVAVKAKESHDIWSSAQPTPQNFEAAIRLWLKDENDRLKPPRETLACIKPPLDEPAPDGASRLKRVMGAYADFFQDAAPSEARSRQLAQLHSLVDVGLLRREAVTLRDAGRVRPAHRFSLTDAGWAAMHPGYDCFNAGDLSFQGIAHSQADTYQGEKIWVVQARLGIEDTHAVAEWALDTHVQQAFPELHRKVEGDIVALSLQRVQGRWQLASPLPSRDGPINEAQQRQFDELKTLPEPTRDELEELVGRLTSKTCLDLPAWGNVPIDRALLGDGNCLPLDPPKVEVLRLHHRAGSAAGRQPTFTYKSRGHFTLPSSVNNPAILAAWSDLRRLGEHGIACSGTFTFDKLRRKAGGGEGRCWLAFDSDEDQALARE